MTLVQLMQYEAINAPNVENDANDATEIIQPPGQVPLAFTCPGQVRSGASCM